MNEFCLLLLRLVPEHPSCADVQLDARSLGLKVPEKKFARVAAHNFRMYLVLPNFGRLMYHQAFPENFACPLSLSPLR